MELLPISELSNVARLDSIRPKGVTQDWLIITFTEDKNGVSMRAAGGSDKDMYT